MFQFEKWWKWLTNWQFWQQSMRIQIRSSFYSHPSHQPFSILQGHEGLDLIPAFTPWYADTPITGLTQRDTHIQEQFRALPAWVCRWEGKSTHIRAENANSTQKGLIGTEEPDFETKAHQSRQVRWNLAICFQNYRSGEVTGFQIFTKSRHGLWVCFMVNVKYLSAE